MNYLISQQTLQQAQTLVGRIVSIVYGTHIPHGAETETEVV